VRQLEDLLKTEAVVLRLEAESEEAGYLKAIFPVPKTPTLVVIRNGELKEYIAPGVAKNEFVRRLSSAFLGRQTSSVPADSAPSSNAVAPPQPVAEDENELHGDGNVPTTNFALESSDSHGQSTPSTEEEAIRNTAPSTSSNTSQLDSIRLEAERKWKDARAKGKGKQKADPDPEADIPQDSAWGKRQAETKKHSDALKKKQQEAREERRRILQRIEDDKAERRMRTESRDEEKKMAKEKAAEEAKDGMSSSIMTGKASKMTSLQVRLFDGSTIRSRFPSSATLRKDIRRWVDAENQNSKDPYTFKVVLTPLPNKNIDETEEDKSLQQLGLAPSATLLLIPVTKFSTAYEGSTGGNIIADFFAMITGFVAWLFSLISGVFSGLGSGPPARNTPASEEPPATRQRQGQTNDGARIRGFQDAGNQRDYQLYNGNSVSGRRVQAMHVTTSLTLTQA
jgi:UBX domain